MTSPADQMAKGGIALHVSPHPDDELIAAPAALMHLRDQGMAVVNLAISLGRPDQARRRRQELEEACRRAGFALRIADPLVPISRNDDMEFAEHAITDQVIDFINKQPVSVVISPWPGEKHHGHAVVGRGVQSALEQADGDHLWWMWSLWSDLPFPSLIVEYGEDTMNDIIYALEAHRGELERNDYRRLVKGRGMLQAVLGPELVFGFGSHNPTTYEYAQLLSEAYWAEGVWHEGQPRRLSHDHRMHATPSKPAPWVYPN